MRTVPMDKGQIEAPSSIDFKEETIMKKSKTILTCAAAACLLVSGIGFACAEGAQTYPQGLKNGYVNGYAQELKNGAISGLKAGLKDGAKQGAKDGLKNGLCGGLKNGLKQGLKNGSLRGTQK